MNLSDAIPDELLPLLPLESKLIDGISKGGVCKPEEADLETTVRGELIRFLCVNPGAISHVHAQGIQIENSFIDGKLNLLNCHVPFPLRIKGSHIDQPIDLGAARTSTIDFTGSRIAGLNAERLQCEHSLFLCKRTKENGDIETFYCEGEVKLRGATIKGNLVCDGGLFIHPAGSTIDAENLHVHGSVQLRNGFVSKGELIFLGAKIEGQFDCENARFENPEKRDGVNSDTVHHAFVGDYLQVGQSMFLRNEFSSTGIVQMYGAELNELDCHRGRFENQDGTCLSLSHTNIKGTLRLWGMFPFKPVGRMIFENTRAANLQDDLYSWPEEAGNLYLDGFEYGSIPFDARANAKERLFWLSLQYPKIYWREAMKEYAKKIYNRFARDRQKRKETEYRPVPGIQPYEQLASVFHSMGLKDEAKAVQVEKDRYLTQHLHWYSKPWRWLLDILVDYGYSPVKVLIPIFVIILIGNFMFRNAYNMGVITPTGDPVTLDEADVPYPTFDPLWYSVDVFLPIVDLHQERYWIPNTGQPEGSRFMRYMIFHIMAGWFLTTLGVAAVTGLVRTE